MSLLCKWFGIGCPKPPTPPTPVPTPIPPATRTVAVVAPPGTAATVYVDDVTPPGGHTGLVNSDGYVAFQVTNLSTSMVKVTADGFDPYQQNGVAFPAGNFQLMVGVPKTNPNDVELPALHATLPAPPTADQIKHGQLTAQGITINTTKWGPMPWWPGCWSWLDKATRKEAATQLRAAGDTILFLTIPIGDALYDEPGQFYSADKFGPLDMTHGLTQIDPEFIALVKEALVEFGFTGVWIGLPAEADGVQPNGHCLGFNRAMALRPLLFNALGPLNQYVSKLLMWDGVFYGWTPAELGEWFNTSFAFEPTGIYGMEHSTGHIPDGEAVEAWQEGGNMRHCTLLLGEFNDGQFDDSVWQILARCLPPGTYKRPADQPSGDDPNPPYHLVNGCVYRVFEFWMYGAVRGTPNSTILSDKAKFIAMGAVGVC